MSISNGATATFNSALTAGAISLTGDASATFNNAVTASSLSMTGGTVTFGAGDNAATISGAANFTGGTNTIYGELNAASIAVQNSGVSATFKQAVDLSGQLSVTNGTAIFEGTVDAGSLSMTGGTTTFNDTVSTGAVSSKGTAVSLIFNDTVTSSNTLTLGGAGSAVTATNYSNVTFNSANNSFTSLALANNNGKIVLGEDASLSFSSAASYYGSHFTWDLSDGSELNFATSIYLRGSCIWNFNYTEGTTGSGATVNFDGGLRIGTNGSGQTTNVASGVTFVVDTEFYVSANTASVGTANATLNIYGTVQSTAETSIATTSNGSTYALPTVINVYSGGELILDNGLNIDHSSGATFNMSIAGTLTLGDQGDTDDHSEDGVTITLNNGALIKAKAETTNVYHTFVYGTDAAVTFDGNGNSLVLKGAVTNAVYDETSGDTTTAATVSAIISGNVTFAGAADLLAVTVNESATLTISGDYTFNSAIDNSGIVSIADGASLDITALLGDFIYDVTSQSYQLTLIDGGATEVYEYTSVEDIFTSDSWTTLTAGMSEDVISTITFVNGVLQYADTTSHPAYWDPSTGELVAATGSESIAEADFTIDTDLAGEDPASLLVEETTQTIASLTIEGDKALSVSSETGETNTLAVTNAITISTDVMFNVALTADSMTINSGTTTLSESISITNALTVAEGATLRLEADGILSGADTVSLGGTLQLGSTVAALDGADFTLSGSSLNIDLDGANASLSNASSISSSDYAVVLTGTGSLSHDAWDKVSSLSVDTGASISFTASADTSSEIDISGSGAISFEIDMATDDYDIRVDVAGTGTDAFTGTLTHAGVEGMVLLATSPDETNRFAFVASNAGKGTVLGTDGATYYLNSLTGNGLIRADWGSSAAADRRFIDLEMLKENTFAGSFKSDSRFGGLIISSADDAATDEDDKYTFTLSGTGYDGTTASLTIKDADVILTNGAKWSGTIELADSSASLTYSGITTSGYTQSSAITGTGSVAITGSALTFSSAVTAGSLSIADSTVVTFNEDVTLTGALTLVSTDGYYSSDNNFNGAVQADSLTIRLGYHNFTDTVTVTEAITLNGGVSTFTGAVTAKSIDANDGTTAFNGSVAVSESFTIDGGNTAVTVGTLTGAGDVTVNSGTLTLTTDADADYTGSLALNGGALVVTDGTLDAAISVTSAGSSVSAATLNSTITLSDGVSLALGGETSLGTDFSLDLSDWTLVSGGSYEIFTNLGTDITLDTDNWDVTGVTDIEGCDTIWYYDEVNDTLTLSFAALSAIMWDPESGSITGGANAAAYAVSDITVDTTQATETATLNAAVGSTVASLSISGDKALTINGEVGLVVSGAISTTVDVTATAAVSAGSLSITSSDASFSGGLTVTGDTYIKGGITTDGVTSEGASLTLTGTNAFGDVYIGGNDAALTISSGTTTMGDLYLSHKAAVTGVGSLTVADGAELNVDTFNLGYWASTDGNSTVNTVTIAGTLNVTNALTAHNGRANITVADTGTLYLEAGLDYGTTSGSGTSTITVDGKLVLGDSGTLAADAANFTVTMNDGSTLATAAGASTVTVYEALAYANSATVTFDASASADDASLVIASTVTGTSVNASILGDVAFTAGSTSLSAVTLNDGSSLTLSGTGNTLSSLSFASGTGTSSTLTLTSGAEVTVAGGASSETTSNTSSIASSTVNIVVGSDAVYSDNTVITTNNSTTTISGGGTVELAGLVVGNTKASVDTLTIEDDTTLHITGDSFTIAGNDSAKSTVNVNGNLIVDGTIKNSIGLSNSVYGASIINVNEDGVLTLNKGFTVDGNYAHLADSYRTKINVANGGIVAVGAQTGTSDYESDVTVTMESGSTLTTNAVGAEVAVYTTLVYDDDATVKFNANSGTLTMATAVTGTGVSADITGGGTVAFTGGATLTTLDVDTDTSFVVSGTSSATSVVTATNLTSTDATAAVTVGDYGSLTMTSATDYTGTLTLAGGALTVVDAEGASSALSTAISVTADSSLSASELNSTITLSEGVSLDLGLTDTAVTFGDDFAIDFVVTDWATTAGSYDIFTNAGTTVVDGLDYSDIVGYDTDNYTYTWANNDGTISLSILAVSSDDPWDAGASGDFIGSPEEEYVFDTTEGGEVVIGSEGATTAGAEFEGGGDIEISGEGTFTSTDDITVVGGTDVTISTTVTVTDGAESTDAGTLAVDNGTVTVATGGSINADITLGVAAGEEEGATATTGKVAAGILTVEGTGASITDGTLEVDKLAGGEVAKATVTVDASLVAGHADGIATLDGATIGADSTLEVKADSTLELTNGAEVAANTTLAADASVTAGLITLTGNKDGGSVTYSNGGSLTTTTHTNATISNTTVTFGQAAATQGGSVAAILGGNALLAGATYEDEVTTTGDHYTNGSTIAVLTGADLTLNDVIIDADTTVTQEAGSAITIAGDSTLYADNADNTTSSNLTVTTDGSDGTAATTTTLTITTFASCSDVTATGTLNLNITLNDTDWSQFIDGINTEDYITNVVLTNVDGGTITSEQLVDLTVNVIVSSESGVSFGYAPVVASYDGSNLVLTIPEPSTTTLSLLALAGLLARRRRSREA